MDNRNLDKLIKLVRKRNPLIHHITNQVTMNDCANITLALGASPIMAMDIKEVQEVTSLSQALVLNMGTLSEKTIEAMIIAGKTANALNIPIVLDPVGVGVSKFRINAAERLLENVKISIIKGNQSEVKTLAGLSASYKGVSSLDNNNSEDMANIATNLSRILDAVVACTGRVDIIGYNNKSILIEGGNRMLKSITGTGCMLASLMGCFAGVTSNLLEAAQAGVLSMNIAAEKAYKRVVDENRGAGSFKVFLLDEIYMVKCEKEDP